MTTKFDAALSAYNQAKAELAEAKKALRPLVDEWNKAYENLCAVCVHPEVEDHHWEDTDGLGNGKWYTKVTCRICHKELADYRGSRPEGIPKATKVTSEGN